MEDIEMKKGIKGIILASTLVSGAAAAELSYNYVEGGLAVIDGSWSQTYTGLDTRASFQFHENIFAFGGLRFLSDDVDYTNLHVGAAYRQSINATTDWWAGGSIEYQEFDGVETCGWAGSWNWNCSSYSDDDVAPALRGGARHMLTDQIEVAASARYVTGDYDYYGIKAQGRYFFTNNLSATAEAGMQDGDPSIFGGVSFFF